MKLRAQVKTVTGKTKHWLGTINDEGMPEKVCELPVAEYIEVVEYEHGYFMLYYDKNNEFITDGWHETLEKAKKQAKFEFEIEEEDWEAIEE